MLVLTRKTNESIRVGDNIEIKVLEIRGSKIILGIQAPRDVSVRRVELRDTRRGGDGIRRELA